MPTTYARLGCQLDCPRNMGALLNYTYVCSFVRLNKGLGWTVTTVGLHVCTMQLCMYCLLHSASAEPGLAVIGRRCWCAPTMDVTGLSTTMPQSPGEIQIISTDRMQETFVVEIRSNGTLSAQFKVMPEPYNYVDIYFKRPGAFCQLQPSLY